ncbi:hypothetical protein KM043_006947 [Ampulex compressa]|nr:hypothetical protein KM043_006947 [Ampulex compressa]
MSPMHQRPLNKSRWRKRNWRSYRSNRVCCFIAINIIPRQKRRIEVENVGPRRAVGKFNEHAVGLCLKRDSSRENEGKDKSIEGHRVSIDTLLATVVVGGASRGILKLLQYSHESI